MVLHGDDRPMHCSTGTFSCREITLLPLIGDVVHDTRHSACPIPTAIPTLRTLRTHLLHIWVVLGIMLPSAATQGDHCPVWADRVRGPGLWHNGVSESDCWQNAGADKVCANRYKFDGESNTGDDKQKGAAWIFDGNGGFRIFGTDHGDGKVM